jgi:hypothetical protein
MIYGLACVKVVMEVWNKLWKSTQAKLFQQSLSPLVGQEDNPFSCQVKMAEGGEAWQMSISTLSFSSKGATLLSSLVWLGFCIHFYSSSSFQKNIWKSSKPLTSIP